MEPTVLGVRTVANNKPDSIMPDNKQATSMLIGFASSANRNVIKKGAENNLMYE